jgi:glutamine synthetase
MLAAGLKGVEEEIQPPSPVEEDVYGFDDQRLEKFYIKTLPSDLEEAIEEFKGSELVRDTLGEHAFNKYLDVKLVEWEDFRRSVTDWEIERYRNL